MVERANIRKEEELKARIVGLLRNSRNPMSTSDLSSKLNKAWHTIDRTCLKLQIDGKLDGFKVGRMNLWKLK